MGIHKYARYCMCSFSIHIYFRFLLYTRRVIFHYVKICRLRFITRFREFLNNIYIYFPPRNALMSAGYTNHNQNLL